MQCPICGRRDFDGSARSSTQSPYTPARGTTIGRVRVTLELIYTCRTCGQQMAGTTSVDVLCGLEQKDLPYPHWAFKQVAEEYGHGWDLRVRGRRFRSDASISTKAGWRDANQYSIERGHKPPPKGWGYTRGRSCYLKTKEANDHMKILSLETLND